MLDTGKSSVNWADNLLTFIVWAVAGLIVVAFMCLLGDLIWHGAERLSWSFLFTEPESAGRKGGIAPILVSTFLILGVTLAIVLPLGLATAILLSEFNRNGGVFSRWINLSLDILAGVPSIVFGLFGNAFFCVYLGLGFSIISGGLTLSCMVLPIFIRTAKAGLSAVPEDWRRGALALGLSHKAGLVHLLLPAAAPAIAVGLILGIGRALAETAALIFTSGYVDRMPSSLNDSGRALAVHIYDLSMNVAGGDKNAYASSLVLITMLILINGLASWVMEHLLHRRIVTS